MQPQKMEKMLPLEYSPCVCWEIFLSYKHLYPTIELLVHLARGSLLSPVGWARPAGSTGRDRLAPLVADRLDRGRSAREGEL